MLSGTIPVDERGTVLYYEDTGAPPSHGRARGEEDYLTIVLIHGSLFHSGIFHNLATHHPLLRLVFLNSRDYPSSTPYTPADIRIMREGTAEEQEAFVRDIGREIAAFLVRFVREGGVPLISVGEGEEGRKGKGKRKRRGGMILLAWSSGVSALTSLLAHAATLPDETREVLSAYLRGVVLHDPSAPALGIPAISTAYHPMRDAALTPTQRGDAFLPFVSSYFEPVSSVEGITEEVLVRRRPLHTVTVSSSHGGTRDRDGDREREKSRWIPTTKKMTPAQLAECTHPGALESNLALRQVRPGIYAANLRRSLLLHPGPDPGEGDDSEDTDEVWPGLEVTVIWCAMSGVDSVWAARGVWDVVRSLDSEEEEGRRRRAEFVQIANANHFVHWDAPERFVGVLAALP